jgi:hypothetical protein
MAFCFAAVAILPPKELNDRHHVLLSKVRRRRLVLTDVATIWCYECCCRCQFEQMGAHVPMSN